MNAGIFGGKTDLGQPEELVMLYCNITIPPQLNLTKPIRDTMKLSKIAVAVSCIALPAFADTITGQVVDSDGQPVIGAKIELTKSKNHVVTDNNGMFSIESKSSDAEVHVIAKGFAHEYIEWDQKPVTITLTQSVIEQIDVIGVPIHTSNLESATPVNVLTGDALKMNQASTLGETLKAELGVHTSYYGPVASSPIIRGLGGPRVLVTQNSLDVSDASRVGADHVVAVESSTARQIEVLRGPATLIYGSGAIGGVVNIVDDRVPTSNEFEGEVEISHNAVAEENHAGFSVTTGADQFALHIDGFWRDGDNYEIPGIAELEDAHHEEHDEHSEENTGELENSASESSGFNIGASHLLENGFVGISYGRLDREYGIPGHSHGHGEEGHDEHEGEDHDEHDGEEHDEHSEESVYGDLEQDRWQLLSELTFDHALIAGMNTRIGYTDYRHAEIEDGMEGTVFSNETLQFKSDFILNDLAGWHSVVSFEYKDVDFEATGEEAFTPPSNTESFSAAYLLEKHFDDVLVQWGFRFEDVNMTADNFEVEIGHHDEDEHEGEEHEGEEGHDDEHHEEELTLVDFDAQEFTPLSFSAGAVWDFTPGYNVGISYTHAQRAPSTAELFSFGPHIGTNTFVVGALFELHEEDGEYHFDLADDSPDVEKSNNIDISLRKFEGDIGFIVSLFYNEVSNYYYQQNTGLFMDDGHGHGHDDDHDEEHHDEMDDGHDEMGEEHDDHDEHSDEEGLPVYLYQAEDATLYGFEAELIWQTTDNLKSRFFTDYTRGELDNGGNLPRISPMRLGAVFNYELNDWQAEFSAVRYAEQDDIAAYETKTDGYTMLDANISYSFDLDGNDMLAYLKVSNITDEEARVHTSFIKDQTLLPGRGFTLGFRGSF